MALIPPFFLDCVVAIGIEREKEKHWIASGFLYGSFLRKIDEKTSSYTVYLVTNRHVVQDQELLYLRFNPREAMPAREYGLEFSEESPPIFHPDQDIDLAIVRINPKILRADGIQFMYFCSDIHIGSRKILEDLGITEGDFGYILGFPMGIIGGERNFVIVRQGVIARIRDYLAGLSKEILMDCMVFPGNSGGPVVTKPEAMCIDGTKSQNVPKLVGIVAQSITYKEVAISPQTGRPRVIFEDNSGLASIVPIQYLVDLIQNVESSKKTEELGETQAEEKGSEPE